MSLFIMGWSDLLFGIYLASIMMKVLLIQHGRFKVMITKAQQKRLLRMWKDYPIENESYLNFRRSVEVKPFKKQSCVIFFRYHSVVAVGEEGQLYSC